MKKEQRPKSVMRPVLNFIYVAVFLMVLAGVCLGPINHITPEMRYRSGVMQKARQIGVSMHAYSNDHDGHYPEGKTSTDIFQQLIDGHYIDDPSIFYVKMPGKVPPQGNHLKPENVGFDMTCCADSSTPDDLPIVFLTGYKVTYQAGARAVPLERSPETWTEWWDGSDVMAMFIAQCDKNNWSRVRPANEDGSIPNFIPADFDPKGKTYRQLTP